MTRVDTTRELQGMKTFELIFIPRHFEKFGVCYTLHSEICVECPVHYKVMQSIQPCSVSLGKLGVRGLKWCYGVNLVGLTK